MNGPEDPSLCGSSHRTTFSAWYAPDTASLKLAVLSPQLTTRSNGGPMNSASPVLRRPPGPSPVDTEPVVAAAELSIGRDPALVAVLVPLFAVGSSPPPLLSTTTSTVAIANTATTAAISIGSRRPDRLGGPSATAIPLDAGCAPRLGPAECGPAGCPP